MKFTGNGFEFSWKFIALTILAVVTMGLFAPYLAYWTVVYFIEHTNIKG